MEEQKAKKDWTRPSKEQRECITPEVVEDLMRQFVTKEQWPSFQQRNKAEFRRIADGYVSKALTLYSKQNNRPYKARVKGLLVNAAADTERFTFDLIFGQRELVIPTRISVQGGRDAINLSDEQIEVLRKKGVLDALLVSDHGAKFFAEVDTELNRLAIADAKYVRMPKSLHGVALSSEQGEAIVSGQAMRYERENPNDKTELLLFEAKYSPVFYTIRSTQVLDEDGRAVTRKVEPPTIETTQTLKEVEAVVRAEMQKDGKTPTQKQHR